MSQRESVKKLVVTTTVGVCIGALIGLAYGYVTVIPLQLPVVWWSTAIGAMRLSGGLSTAVSNDRPEWRIWRTLLFVGAIGAVAMELYRERELLEFLKMMDQRVYSGHVLLGAAVGVIFGRFPFVEVLPRQVHMQSNVPDDVKPYVDRAQALEENEEYDEAIRVYRDALSRFPDNPVIHNNLGCALANLERYSEAQNHFEMAIALTESNRKANLLVPKYYPAVPEENLSKLRLCVNNKKC